MAWDEEASQHVYWQDADLAFSAEGILHVGGRYEGPVDDEIAGAALMVMPGLVNVHCHSGDEPIAKGFSRMSALPPSGETPSMNTRPWSTQMTMQRPPVRP